jgi:hypothetical protein
VLEYVRVGVEPKLNVPDGEVSNKLRCADIARPVTVCRPCGLRPPRMASSVSGLEAAMPCGTGPSDPTNKLPSTPFAPR